MPVGSGKTLVSFLAPTVLGSVRPILILPAKLRDVKTPRDFARYAKDWRAPSTLRIISYEQLSRDYGDEKQLGYHGQPLGILDLADPDLIMDDEVHRFKNPRAACTRKMRLFMDTHPNVIKVALSGTITKDKIEDYTHVVGWTHKNAAPVPRVYSVLKDWAGALNVKVDDEDRVEVGALLEFATEEERRILDPTTAARRGFRRRLIETPGVVAYAKEYDGASLLIEEAPEPDYSSRTEEIFSKFRLDGVLPNDTTTSGGLENWRHEREMARGFCYFWDPPAPEPWKNARAEWHAAVRYVIGNSDRDQRLDSEWQVANACNSVHRRGQMWEDARRAYAAWVAIRDTFKIEQVAVWHDDAPWECVADWMDRNKGLVWVEHIEFGNRLAKETGARYFQRGGLDASGMAIEDARPDRDGSIIVSIESNKEGRNLQEYWCDNFFTVPPKGSDAAEQSFGRTHRPGQVADEVTVEIAIWSKADANAWLSIMAESRYVVDSSGLPAKVLYADVTIPDVFDFEARALRTARFAGPKIII